MKNRKKKADLPKRPKNNDPIEFGVSSKEKGLRNRRPNMRLSKQLDDSTHEVEMSVSNIQSHFEEYLRRYKYLHDREDLTGLTIGNVTKGFDIQGKPTDVVKLRYKIKREEVEVVRPW